jgi:hypothetical protein
LLKCAGTLTPPPDAAQAADAFLTKKIFGDAKKPPPQQFAASVASVVIADSWRK